MPAGRPPKWETPEQVQDLIDSYFKNTPEDEWTITGLALALGAFRSTLMDYQEKDQFYYTIKTAKEKIHNAYEKDLRKKGRSGDIFALKNFGWTDRQEVEQKVQVDGSFNGSDISKIEAIAKEYDEKLKKAMLGVVTYTVPPGSTNITSSSDVLASDE